MQEAATSRGFDDQRAEQPRINNALLAHNNVEEEEAFFDLIADTQVRRQAQTQTGALLGHLFLSQQDCGSPRSCSFLL